MRRRDFITLLSGAATAWPLGARAQATRAPRIGWLSTGSPTSHRFSLAAFRHGLHALGYIEGTNVTIEYRWAEGNLDRLPNLVSDLVQDRVDIILAGGTFGAQAATNATTTIPIVAAGAGDLVEAGLVKSLAEPGGNLTGFTANVPEAGAKRLQIMKEIMPTARRAAILYSNSLELQTVKESKATLDVGLTFYEVRTSGDLESALIVIPKDRPDVFVILNDPFIFTHRRAIIAAAAGARLPAIYGFREFVDDGGLISYGANISDTYRRAASYVDRILKGAKPADLPVQQPITFEMIINLKTANTLGLSMPPTLLVRADEVID
jgi:putative ABC transport system substrate-binding protein